MDSAPINTQCLLICSKTKGKQSSKCGYHRAHGRFNVLLEPTLPSTRVRYLPYEGQLRVNVSMELVRKGFTKVRVQICEMSNLPAAPPDVSVEIQVSLSRGNEAIMHGSIPIQQSDGTRLPANELSCNVSDTLISSTRLFISIHWRLPEQESYRPGKSIQSCTSEVRSCMSFSLRAYRPINDWFYLLDPDTGKLKHLRVVAPKVVCVQPAAAAKLVQLGDKEQLWEDKASYSRHVMSCSAQKSASLHKMLGSGMNQQSELIRLPMSDVTNQWSSRVQLPDILRSELPQGRPYPCNNLGSMLLYNHSTVIQGRKDGAVDISRFMPSQAHRERSRPENPKPSCFENAAKPSFSQSAIAIMQDGLKSEGIEQTTMLPSSAGIGRDCLVALACCPTSAVDGVMATAIAAPAKASEVCSKAAILCKACTDSQLSDFSCCASAGIIGGADATSVHSAACDGVSSQPRIAAMFTVGDDDPSFGRELLPADNASCSTAASGGMSCRNSSADTMSSYSVDLRRAMAAMLPIATAAAAAAAGGEVDKAPAESSGSCSSRVVSHSGSSCRQSRGPHLPNESQQLRSVQQFCFACAAGAGSAAAAGGSGEALFDALHCEHGKLLIGQESAATQPSVEGLPQPPALPSQPIGMALSCDSDCGAASETTKTAEAGAASASPSLSSHSASMQRRSRAISGRRAATVTVLAAAASDEQQPPAAVAATGSGVGGRSGGSIKVAFARVASAAELTAGTKRSWQRSSTVFGRSKSLVCATSSTVPPPAHALFLADRSQRDRSQEAWKTEGGDKRNTFRKIARNVRNMMGLLRLQKSSRSGQGYQQITVQTVEHWALSFSGLLADREGVELFRSFLRSEYSEENIEFWLACEDYRCAKSSSATKLQAKARAIFTRFVAPHAPKEVNLDSKTRLDTECNLERPDCNTFEPAKQRIQCLMEKDSYPRFLRSQLYLDFIEQLRGSRAGGSQ